MILKRPSFRRGGNAGIASLRVGAANGFGGATKNPVKLPSSNPVGTRTVPLQTVARNPFEVGQMRGQNILSQAKNFASKFIPRTPSGIMKAIGTARVLAPGVTNPYFLAGAATVGPYAATVYQLNEARKRGELLDPVSNPYETEFGVLTEEDFANENFYGAPPKKETEKETVTVTEEETEEPERDGFEGEERPRKTYSEQLKEISNTVIPNKKGETASTGEKTYETAYDAEVKKLEKLLGKNNYKGEVAIALSDAIGTPGSIADKASALNKQLLNIMGAKKKQKGRIAEIAYDAVNKIKMAEIQAGKMTGNEKLQKRAENLLKIIENPKTPNAIKKRAEADLARLEKSISMLGKGDSIQLRRDKTAMLQQLNTALIGIKSKKKGSKERNELIEQLKAQYKINVGGYPEFKEDFDRIITSAGIEGVDVTKFAMGGRVKRADGTPKSDISGAVKMEETVKETVNTGPETPTAPVKKMDYAEIRNRLPKEITDDVVQLISQSQEAMQDFAYIRTQGDVDAFNLKYGVNLVLPANT